MNEQQNERDTAMPCVGDTVHAGDFGDLVVRRIASSDGSIWYDDSYHTNDWARAVRAGDHYVVKRAAAEAPFDETRCVNGVVHCKGHCLRCTQEQEVDARRFARVEGMKPTYAPPTLSRLESETVIERLTQELAERVTALARLKAFDESQANQIARLERCIAMRDADLAGARQRIGELEVADQRTKRKARREH